MAAFNESIFRKALDQVQRTDRDVWQPPAMPLINLVEQIANFIAEKLPKNKSNQPEIPPGFIPVKVFSEKYNLTSVDWLRTVIALIQDKSHSIKTPKGWYVHPENIIFFFASPSNAESFPVMHKRCKRYLANCDQEELKKMYEV